MGITKINTLIIGAGIAGLGAAHELQKNREKCLILERNSSFGGLLDNFTINGFRFDKFIHLSFTNNKVVREIFDRTPYIKHQPKSYNYYQGYWLKHPAQNNLYKLPYDEKQKIIDGFINRPLKDVGEIVNYEDWLRVQYGDYFAENFPLVYTKKYWTVEAKELEIKWVGSRMYRPTIEEVIQGSETDETPNTYYASEMRYPQKGGYKSFLDPLTEGLDIQYGQEVVSIDSKNRIVITNKGDTFHYDYIINTMPLPELTHLLSDVPSHVLIASQELRYTSGAIISLGFNKPDLADKLWYYIYDQDVPPARVYSPSLKSPDNCPNGCSSIQAEYYFDWNNGIKINDVLDKTIEKFIEMKLFKEEDVLVKDIRIEKYANVMFDHKIYENRKLILDFISSKGILSAGRFGEWEYFWSDQSLISGIEKAKKIVSQS